LNITIKKEDGCIKFIDNEDDANYLCFVDNCGDALLKIFAVIYAQNADPEQLSKLFERYFVGRLIKEDFRELREQTSEQAN